MLFMKETVARSMLVWDVCLNSPFIRELKEGTLSQEKFRLYTIQNSVYLKRYARVYGKAIYHAASLRNIQAFYFILSFFTESGSVVRSRYLSDAGLTDDDIEDCPPLPENQSYIDFMTKTVSRGNINEILMAILPCVLSYSYLLRALVSGFEPVSPVYSNFITNYADDGYHHICISWSQFADAKYAGPSQEEKPALQATFRQGSLLEFDFWNMAYRTTEKGRQDMMKQVLTITDSDCSGGVGIQVDLKTFSAYGVFGMSAIVAAVVENTSRMIDTQDTAPVMITGQIDAAFEGTGTDAVKVGMLSTPACMTAVADRLKQRRSPHAVIDPVTYAKNGCPLMESDAISFPIITILPLADVLTPDIPEAEEITGVTISSVADMEAAARRINRMGCRAVIVKGGHSSGNALDVPFDGTEIQYFEIEWIHTKNTHGTGCTFSSAIAAQLALGAAAPEATARAKAYVTTAIRYALPLGKGNGLTHHFYNLYYHGLPELEREGDLS